MSFSVIHVYHSLWYISGSILVCRSTFSFPLHTWHVLEYCQRLCPIYCGSRATFRSSYWTIKCWVLEWLQECIVTRAHIPKPFLANLVLCCHGLCTSRYEFVIAPIPKPICRVILRSKSCNLLPKSHNIFVVQLVSAYPL